MMLSLDEYRKLCTRNICRWCNAPLPEAVLAYPHPNGWPVKDMAGLQWLYLECVQCGYCWALWKLGVNRFPEELLEKSGDR
jgi:hypothetical protein